MIRESELRYEQKNWKASMKAAGPFNGSEIHVPDRGNGFFRTVLNRFKDDDDVITGFAILLLHEEGTLSTRELGKLFGINSGTVSRRMARVKRIIRKELDDPRQAADERPETED